MLTLLPWISVFIDKASQLAELFMQRIYKVTRFQRALLVMRLKAYQ
jgi:hypothetical protein